LCNREANRVNPIKDLQQIERIKIRLKDSPRDLSLFIAGIHFGLNPAHSAISCGDVFRKDQGKMFVVLRQPCDLVTRQNATKTNSERKAKEVVWVEIRESTGSEKAGAFSFVLEGAGEKGRDWVVDFRRSAFVDLTILDFAAFSNAGELSLSASQEDSPLFVPGLKHLFDAAKKDLTNLKEKWPEKRRLSLSGAVPSAIAKWDAAVESVRFPYSRIARVNQPWAQAILASFAAYHTRTALDHNFARRLLDSEPAEETAPKA
jgi:hypothetical protein